MSAVSLNQFESIRQQARQKIEAQPQRESAQDWKTLIENKRSELFTSEPVSKSRSTQNVNALSKVNDIRSLQQYSRMKHMNTTTEEMGQKAPKRLLGNYIDIVG